MRLTKNQISNIAKNIVQKLLEQKMMTPLVEKERLIDLIEDLIIEDFMGEDRLNQEVREIMKNYSEQIEKGDVDYNKMFHLIKQKIAKERGIIL